MKQYIQTLQRYNAWRRGEDVIEQPDPRSIGEAIDGLINAIAELERDRDDWKAEAGMRSKEIEVWKYESSLLRGELIKADNAIQSNIDMFLHLRSEIQSLREQLGIARKDWLN